jgi:hypothetical protein
MSEPSPFVQATVDYIADVSSPDTPEILGGHMTCFEMGVAAAIQNPEWAKHWQQELYASMEESFEEGTRIMVDHMIKATEASGIDDGHTS